MNPIIASYILDDSTVKSCEPNSLRAVLDAIMHISYKVRKNRIKIHTIYVKYLHEPEPDADNTKMWNVKYQVNLGFYVKDEWFNAKVIMRYYYAPGSCSNANTECIEFTKQIGDELVPFKF